MGTKDKNIRTGATLEENMKKALTEMLMLFLLRERECYIGELTAEIEKRSKGALSIVFPYAVIYRMTDVEYITESRKRIAPDGRRRQYYRITEAGDAYLTDLLATYRRLSIGVEEMLSTGGADHG